MTFDPMQHGGRTHRQVECNENAVAILLFWAALMLMFAGSVSVGGWLVATVAGWL